MNHKGDPCVACNIEKVTCYPSCVFRAYFHIRTAENFGSYRHIKAKYNPSKLQNEIMDLLEGQRTTAFEAMDAAFESRYTSHVWAALRVSEQTPKIKILREEFSRLEKELSSGSGYLINLDINTTRELTFYHGGKIVANCILTVINHITHLVPPTQLRGVIYYHDYFNVDTKVYLSRLYKV
ncbi:hypothetical protein LIER_10322 [Lithospermum erythrorhizon]|uniref:LOB domain-containing protein n=1 Tax=Lithospermum erythrorhizon TaxID=34254 RepID=A0AAV3PK48_LITER